MLTLTTVVAHQSCTRIILDDLYANSVSFIQLPLPTESSTGPHSVSTDELPSHDLEYNPLTVIALMLSVIGGIVIFPMIAEKIKINDKDKKSKTAASKKPKAYYQFWATHVVILALLIYTLKSVQMKVTVSLGIIFGFYVALVLGAFLYLFAGDKFNTPTQCCICHRFCKKGCSIVVTMTSLFMITLFVSLCIVILPTVIFIYYLYPANTLIRMPFIINSILYVNSLLALLLFQCERLSCVITKLLYCNKCTKNEDEKFYDEYYNKVFKKGSYSGWNILRYGKERIGSLLTYLVQPVLTFGILTILVEFIEVLSDLFRLNQDHFDDKDQVETLILLVPTMLLLFGSWWKLDIFFDIEEPRSKKELLHEILEEMKKRKLAIEMESPANLPSESLQNTADTDTDDTLDTTDTDDSTPLLRPEPPATYSSVNN